MPRILIFSSKSEVASFQGTSEAKRIKTKADKEKRDSDGAVGDGDGDGRAKEGNENTTSAKSAPERTAFACFNASVSSARACFRKSKF